MKKNEKKKLKKNEKEIFFPVIFIQIYMQNKLYNF